MNANEFSSHFILKPVNKAQGISPKNTDKIAAVLVALIKRPHGLELMLTKRSQHLTLHPGQISFPGGKRELADKNLIETALREADEEINLKAQQLEILGTLHPYTTVTGFSVTPVIGLVNAPINIQIDPNEVDEYFTVPFSFILNKNNRQYQQFFRQGKAHKICFIPYKDKFIWGATAAIIDELCQHIND